MVAEVSEKGGQLVLQDARGEFRRTRLDGGRECLAAPDASDDGVP